MCQGASRAKSHGCWGSTAEPRRKVFSQWGTPWFSVPCIGVETLAEIGPSNDMRGYWPHRGVFTACKGRACEHSAQLRETPANLPAMEPHSQTSSTDNQVLHYTLHTEAPSDHPCARGHHGRKVMAAGAAMLNPAAKSSRETGVSQ